ncbi:MAG TPA: hypothetical protein VLI54_06590 [Bacillota bacterium]|nr:hypothetical protein [Bacillota bacterium]
MNEYDIEAHRSAAAMLECPFRSLAQVKADIAAHGSDLNALAAEQKEELFARVAPHIDNMLDSVDSHRDSMGRPQLQMAFRRLDTSEIFFQNAAPEQITNWHYLSSAWNNTLNFHLERVVDQRSADWLALEALVAVRMQAIGVARDTLTHLRGGIGTATDSIASTIFGMSGFIEDLDRPLIRPKASIIRKSVSPILQLTDLELQQNSEFAYAYLGHTVIRGALGDFTVVDFPTVSRALYHMLPHEVVTFAQAPEHMPVAPDRLQPPATLVGEAPSVFPGPRMGCPIRLSPRQAQKLWDEMVLSAARGGLLDGDPAQYAGAAA